MKNEARVITIFIGILTALALGAVLHIAQRVIVPLVIAVLLSFILEPLVRVLTRIKIPRIVAVVIAIGLFIGFLFFVGLFLFNTAQSFVERYPDYLNKMDTIFQDFNSRYLKRLQIPNDFVENIDWTDTLKQYILAWSGSFLRFLLILAVIVLFLFFLFFENPMFKEKLKRAFPLHTSRRFTIVMEHINRQVSRYLGVKFLVSAGTGILVYIALTIIGLDFALIWAALAFFMNFIPNIGSVISGSITIIVGIIQFYPRVGMMVVVAAAVVVIQIGMGSFVDPLMQGERLDLSPVVILFSLLFWGWLWGVIGAILAVPLIATIRIVMMNVPLLKPVGVMIGGIRKRHRRRRRRKS
jgi:predicted PurR-regulated permease PerM